MTAGGSRSAVDRIVDAVLYEGYILYPYRSSSVKNRQRWTFGGIYPQYYSRASNGSEPCTLHTECLVTGTEQTALDTRVRFLHLVDRLVGALVTPVRELPPTGCPPVDFVQSLRVGDRLYTPWQEAVEREIHLAGQRLGELATAARRQTVVCPATELTEPITDASGAIVGMLLRRQETIEGTAEVSAQRLGEGLFRVTVSVVNVSAERSTGECANRDAALLQALVSAHVILDVREGQFVSLLEPSEQFRQAAAACRNVGVWPVLVGDAGCRETMLASPIILYDYPEVAPESPGDLFDGTEIDEILTLRILAMTDAEKQEMRDTDERARALLDRTEHLGPEQLARLHGAMRSPHSLDGGTP